jgi:hypothetical protein
VLTEVLVKKYRAVYIADCHNASDLPRGAQWLVFDEVGPSNKLHLCQLKGLTSGHASVSSINRKSYGSSYVPRSDAQLFIVGNHSPEETYAVTDQRTKLKRVSAELMEPIYRRFHIIRLNGDHQQDRIKWTDPKGLADADYLQNIRDTFYDLIRDTNATQDLSTRTVRFALIQCLQLHKMRTSSLTDLTQFARDMYRAIPIRDYAKIKNVMDLFCTRYSIPLANPRHEFAMHFTEDPKRDLYGEMVRNMRVDPRLLPTFDRHMDLTETGPVVGNPRAERALADAVYERLTRDGRDTGGAREERHRERHRRQRTRDRPPNVDPRNHHYMARLLPPNERDADIGRDRAVLRQRMAEEALPENAGVAHTTTGIDSEALDPFHYPRDYDDVQWREPDAEEMEAALELMSHDEW